MQDKQTLLALQLIEELSHHKLRDKFTLISIDVSKAFAPSKGKREIVVEIEDELILSHNGKKHILTFPKLLRFSPKNYPQQLGNFLTLQNKMHQDYGKQIGNISDLEENIRFAKKVVDLRIDDLAFIDEN